MNRIVTLSLLGFLSYSTTLFTYAMSSDNVEFKFKLQAGWNPVVVGREPEQPDPKSFFQKLIETGQLLSIWSFAPGEGWSRFDVSDRAVDVPKPPSPPDLDQGNGGVKKLEAIVAGRAYWVELRDSVPAGGIEFPCRVRLGRIVNSLKTGWNLLGFDLDSPVTAEQLFRAQADKVQAIFRYDANTKDLKLWQPGTQWPSFEPNQAYWVKVGQDVTLQPRLQSILTPDIAVRKTGEVRTNTSLPGDADFNRNGAIDNESSQDTIFIDGLSTAGNLTVRNVGDGSLFYQVEAAGCWKSPDSRDGGYPPIQVDQRGDLRNTGWVPVDHDRVPWLTVEKPTGISPALDVGTGLAQRDRSLTLTPNRDGLGPGYYLARFHIRSTGGDATVFAVMAVPTLSGDYEGEVLVTSVSGRPRDVGRLGLRVCVDEAGAGPLRGVLDSEGSLVFSTDVMLVGDYIRPARGRFVLAGSLTLPARAASDGTDHQDNGNPLPTRLIRDVSLIGSETTPGTIRGEYSEVIRGPLPFPIILTGTFGLRRVADPKRRAGGPLQPTKRVPAFGTYAGRVFGDLGDGQPTALADASVVLTGAHLQRVARTDSQGAFRFESLTPGVYGVTASLPGFEKTSAGSRHAQRLIDVKGGETILAADDLGDEPHTLTLARRYAAPDKDHILAIAEDPHSPTKVSLVSIAERRFTSVLWFVKSDTPTELTQGDRRTLSIVRPGLYPIELWLQQPEDANEGKYRKVRDTLVIGPLGSRLKPDKTWETVPADSVPRQMRTTRVGTMVGAEPSSAELPGGRRFVLQGASAGGPMVGASEGLLHGQGIRLEVGPVSAFGPEVIP